MGVDILREGAVENVTRKVMRLPLVWLYFFLDNRQIPDAILFAMFQIDVYGFHILHVLDLIVDTGNFNAIFRFIDMWSNSDIFLGRRLILTQLLSTDRAVIVREVM